MATAQTVVDPGITYQGVLEDGGGPVNGLFDMEFRIFDSASSGSSLAPEVIVDDVQVSNGVFSAILDFGDAPFDGSALWLEIRLRRDGASGMNILEPRQAISPTPYALQALMVDSNSVSSTNIVNNSVTAADIASNAVTASEIATNAVGLAELADGAVDAGAVSLPLFLTGANSGNAELLQSGVLVGINSAPTTPSDNHSPYGVIGSIAYSGGTVSPLFLPPAGILGHADASGNTGIGVMGLSGDSAGLGAPPAAGVYGLAQNASGVRGRSLSSSGVAGSSNTGVGVSGTSASSFGGDFSGESGLQARGTATNSYGAEIVSEQYRGLLAESEAGFFDGYFGAGFGVSANSFTDRGASAKILAVNLGDETIQPGDLVALAGLGVNPETGKPVVGVARISDANAHGVIGVGERAISVEEEKLESGKSRTNFLPSDGAVNPDNYLLVVTSGLAAQVRLPGLNKSSMPAIGRKISIDAGGQAHKHKGGVDEVVVGKVAGEVDPQTLMVPIYIDID